MAKKNDQSNWRGKDRNLTTEQAARARRLTGGGRSQAITDEERTAAASNQVDVGTTKWMTAKERGGKGRGGLAVGADGKAITGTVKMPDGSSVQYVRGKRIGVLPAKAEKPAAAGGGQQPGKPGFKTEQQLRDQRRRQRQAQNESVKNATWKKSGPMASTMGSAVEMPKRPTTPEPRTIVRAQQALQRNIETGIQNAMGMKPTGQPEMGGLRENAGFKRNRRRRAM